MSHIFYNVPPVDNPLKNKNGLIPSDGIMAHLKALGHLDKLFWPLISVLSPLKYHHCFWLI